MEFSTPLDIFVIHNSDTGGSIVDDVTAELRLRTNNMARFTTDESELDTADRVLLVLTEGALSSPSLTQLERILYTDEQENKDRLVCMTLYSLEAGWSFGCFEQRSASEHVQEALNCHEAITYRPKVSNQPCQSSRNRHEFTAMAAQLLKQLQKEPPPLRMV